MVAEPLVSCRMNKGCHIHENGNSHISLTPETSTMAAKGKNVRYGILVRRRVVRVIYEHGLPAHRFGFTDVLKWTVATDETVSVDDSRNPYAIELNSTPLDYSSDALEQIKMVVELLVVSILAISSQPRIKKGSENIPGMDALSLAMAYASSEKLSSGEFL